METNNPALIAAHIEKKNFCGLYLFYGEEDYLINYYADKIIAANCVNELNRQNILKEDFSPKKLAESYLACPIEGGKRVIAVFDSGAFAVKKGGGESAPKEPKGKKKGAQNAAPQTVQDCLEQIPDTAVVVFIEKTADKRAAAYKTAVKTGFCAEINRQDPKTLANWAAREAKNLKSVLSASDAAYFIANCGDNMYAYSNELKKLSAYSGGKISRADIDAVCSKTLESKIFALTDAAGERNAAKALLILDDLIKLKMSPFFILIMLFNLFKSILLIKRFTGQPDGVIAQKTGLNPYTLKKAREFAVNFTVTELETAVLTCLDTDVRIKSGLMSDRLGVERIILL